MNEPTAPAHEDRPAGWFGAALTAVLVVAVLAAALTFLSWPALAGTATPADGLVPANVVIIEPPQSPAAPPPAGAAGRREANQSDPLLNVRNWRYTRGSFH